MTHTYEVKGMTCTGCEAKVKNVLSHVKGVKNVNIDLVTGKVTIDMDKHISVSEFKTVLKDYPKYQISENGSHAMHIQPVSAEETKTWFEIYKPIVLIFAYLLGITLLIEAMNSVLIWERWMSHFMAGFFLMFSFFKLLNLKGFTESYAMYDVVAKKWNTWGYSYAFIELALGIAYLTDFNPLLTNIVTFLVMSISIIGVLQSVLTKRKIKCACLGAVFNLPMSTITIIEDALMIAMSLMMIITLV